MIVTNGQRGPYRTYSREYYQRIVRDARRVAGLPDFVKLNVAGVTFDSPGLGISATVDNLQVDTDINAARRYVKKTEIQRLGASRKRRAWRNKLEQIRNESQKTGDQPSQKKDK